MSTFYTISEEIVKPSFDVKVENLDASSDHWRTTKYIVGLVEALELVLYNKPDFESAEQDLIKYWLSLIKENPRIEQIHLYTCKKDKNKLICLTVSEVLTFKPENLLKRSIICSFKKQNKVIIINDITTKEFDKIKGDASLLPKEWQLHETLTNKFAKYKALFV